MATRIQVMKDPVLSGMAQGLKGLGGLAGNIVGGVMQKKANDRDIDQIKSDSSALLSELQNNKGLRESWDKSGYGVGYDDFVGRFGRVDKFKDATKAKDYLRRQYDVAEKVLGDKLSTNWLAQASESFGVGDFGQRIKDRKAQDAASKVGEQMTAVRSGKVNPVAAYNNLLEMGVPANMASSAMGSFNTIENRRKDNQYDAAIRGFGSKIIAESSSPDEAYTTALKYGTSEPVAARLASLVGSKMRLNKVGSGSDSGTVIGEDDYTKELMGISKNREEYVEGLQGDIGALDNKIAGFSKDDIKKKPVVYNALLKQRKVLENMSKLDNELLKQMFKGETEKTMLNAVRDRARNQSMYETFTGGLGERFWGIGGRKPESGSDYTGWQYNEDDKTYISPGGDTLSYDELMSYGSRFDTPVLTTQQERIEGRKEQPK